MLQRRRRFAGHAGLPLFVALSAALSAAVIPSAASPQMPAPYGLSTLRDCDITSEYSAEKKSTVVQLALVPPGPAGEPAAVSLALRAEYAGRMPGSPPGAINVLVLPTILSSPNVQRGFELELMVYRAGARPLRLFYFGRSWGEVGYVAPGDEVTRVGFSMSAADLQALLLGERVTGRVMNFGFEFTNRHLAALRLFAMTIGVPDPADTRSER
jgi:hypothetical protein